MDQVFQLEHTIIHMMFTISFEDDMIQDQDVSFVVKESKDIERLMDLYFEKAWEELFIDDWDYITPIADVSYDGISMIGRDNQDNEASFSVRGSYQHSRISVNTKALNDKNVEKLNSIRKILSDV